MSSNVAVVEISGGNFQSETIIGDARAIVVDWDNIEVDINAAKETLANLQEARNEKDGELLSNLITQVEQTIEELEDSDDDEEWSQDDVVGIPAEHLGVYPKGAAR
jgi:hypothetical protein